MISKSKFILGQQCLKSLWLDSRNIPTTNPLDKSANERLKAGNEVGEAAKNLLPGGVNVEYHPSDFQKMCDLTSELIGSGEKIIYEASFFADNVFIRVDIMKKTSKGWDIYEVKSSTKAHKYHEEDAALQWHVLKQINYLTLNNIFIVVLNNKYLKSGDIIYDELFNIKPVTKYVEANQSNIKEQIKVTEKVLLQEREPSIKIGSHCKKPHQCEYFDKCWPANINNIDSIFNLYRLNLEKKLSLLDKGEDTFKKIKDRVDLTTTQKNQIKAHEQNQPILNKSKINDFISSVKYPISYLDFETFTDAIPLFDGQKPYMQMPFQYSLHIQNNIDENLGLSENHFEFIAKVKDDPRRFIAESLLKNLPSDGSIMAYNQSFEKNCIETLAKHCPDLSDELLALNDRFVDLIVPFRGGGYYDSSFKGSFSIKSVLPALCPDDEILSYKKLKIKDGSAALNSYKEMRLKSDKERADMRKELFKYCRLDTFAMYSIYMELIKSART